MASRFRKELWKTSRAPANSCNKQVPTAPYLVRFLVTAPACICDLGQTFPSSRLSGRLVSRFYSACRCGSLLTLPVICTDYPEPIRMESVCVCWLVRALLQSPGQGLWDAPKVPIPDGADDHCCCAINRLGMSALLITVTANGLFKKCTTGVCTAIEMLPWRSSG